jgi:RNA polymerase sigma-70 factor (ECF subfamily)
LAGVVARIVFPCGIRYSGAKVTEFNRVTFRLFTSNIHETMGMLAEAPSQSDLRDQQPEDLMARYQQADEAAAAQLIRLLSPMLLRFLSSRNATRSHAEDLLQECWLRIHKARHTYRPGKPLLPWIFAIAHHTRVDGFRRLRRIESHELAADELLEGKLPGHQPSPIVALTLSRLLEELPESQREVVFLLKVCGMSLEEVARAHSTTIGAVKQKAHRAYEKLRSLLSENSNGSVKR